MTQHLERARILLNEQTAIAGRSRKAERVYLMRTTVPNLGLEHSKLAYNRMVASQVAAEDAEFYCELLREYIEKWSKEVEAPE